MDASPFAKLAPELRNEMYKLAVVVDTPIEVIVEARRGPRSRYPLRAKKTLALTTTCRQIRSEILPIFYGANRFELSFTAFKLPNPHRLTKYDLRKGSRIACKRSQKAEDYWRKSQVPVPWRWFHQIGEENTKSLRSVDILLGKWNPPVWYELQPLTALASNLAPIVKLFSRTKATCIVIIDVGDYFKGNYSRGLWETSSDFRLPITTFTRSTHQLDTIYANRNKKLEKAEKKARRRGSDGWWGYEAQLHRHLNRSIEPLKRLFYAIQAAAKDESNNLF